MGRSFRALTAVFVFLALALPCRADLPVITAKELRDTQLKEAELVLWDARDKRSYDAAHITGAQLPLDPEFYRATELFAKGLRPEAPDSGAALKQAVKGMNKEKLVVTYCNRNCKASQILGMQLESLGFKNVRWMEEGLQSWEEKGYPVTIGAPKLRDN